MATAGIKGVNTTTHRTSELGAPGKAKPNGPPGWRGKSLAPPRNSARGRPGKPAIERVLEAVSNPAGLGLAHAAVVVEAPVVGPTPIPALPIQPFDWHPQIPWPDVSATALEGFSWTGHQLASLGEKIDKSFHGQNDSPNPPGPKSTPIGTPMRGDTKAVQEDPRLGRGHQKTELRTADRPGNTTVTHEPTLDQKPRSFDPDDFDAFIQDLGWPADESGEAPSDKVLDKFKRLFGLQGEKDPKKLIEDWRKGVEPIPLGIDQIFGTISSLTPRDARALAEKRNLTPEQLAILLNKDQQISLDDSWVMGQIAMGRPRKELSNNVAAEVFLLAKLWNFDPNAFFAKTPEDEIKAWMTQGERQLRWAVRSKSRPQAITELMTMYHLSPEQVALGLSKRGIVALDLDLTDSIWSPAAEKSANIEKLRTAFRELTQHLEPSIAYSGQTLIALRQLGPERNPSRLARSFGVAPSTLAKAEKSGTIKSLKLKRGLDYFFKRHLKHEMPDIGMTGAEFAAFLKLHRWGPDEAAEKLNTSKTAVIQALLLFDRDIPNEIPLRAAQYEGKLQ